MLVPLKVNPGGKRDWETDCSLSAEKRTIIVVKFRGFLDKYVIDNGEKRKNCVKRFAHTLLALLGIHGAPAEHRKNKFVCKRGFPKHQLKSKVVSAHSLMKENQCFPIGEHSFAESGIFSNYNLGNRKYRSMFEIESKNNGSKFTY